MDKDIEELRDEIRLLSYEVMRLSALIESQKYQYSYIAPGEWKPFNRSPLQPANTPFAASAGFQPYVTVKR